MEVGLSLLVLQYDKHVDLALYGDELQQPAGYPEIEHPENGRGSRRRAGILLTVLDSQLQELLGRDALRGNSSNLGISWRHEMRDMSILDWTLRDVRSLLSFSGTTTLSIVSTRKTRLLSPIVSFAFKLF